MKWYCPNCNSSAYTVDEKVPMHPCKGMTGLMAPLVPEGVKAKVERMEREDYIGTDQVQFDGEGKPTMAVKTTRDDGEDCTIFAPTANVGVEATERK